MQDLLPRAAVVATVIVLAVAAASVVLIVRDTHTAPSCVWPDAEVVSAVMPGQGDVRRTTEGATTVVYERAAARITIRCSVIEEDRRDIFVEDLRERATIITGDTPVLVIDTVSGTSITFSDRDYLISIDAKQFELTEQETRSLVASVTGNT